MEEFSLDVVKGIGSFAGRIKYITSHLPKLGSGSSRTVFKISDTIALKVAKNQKGIAQNYAEINMKGEYPSVLSPIYDYDDNGIFLQMGLASKCTAKQFTNIMGFTMEDLDAYLMDLRFRWKGKNKYVLLRPPSPEQKMKIEEMHDNEWVMDLCDMIVNYDYTVPGDFTRLSTYGIAVENGVPSVVVIDYGATNEVMATHYRRY